VNKSLKFPRSSQAGHSSVPPASSLEATNRHHAVQFYEDGEFLFETVSRFLVAGLEANESLLVIATPEHRDGILRHLAPFEIERAIASGQVILCDANEMLGKFMVGDTPDPDLFHDALARVMSELKSGNRARKRVRAFGEMVDVLWRQGNGEGALQLEALWSQAQAEYSLSLLCAYLMGDFYKEVDSARFVEVCGRHTHVMPTETFSRIQDPEHRLREISLLQQRARSLENEIEQREQVENALRDALRERARVEEELRTSLDREKEARARAEASDAFKEVFIGILGHDLRNPLNTVLTTARLMILRHELPPESVKRLERVVASGTRMERMIEQLLDLARARLADGIPITRGEEKDLTSLVLKVVSEVRLMNPNHMIVVSGTSCTGRVDEDRFEQVVSQLVRNAVTHGDSSMPIDVELTESSDEILLRVHNYGRPIDPALMPILFDPFKRGARPDASTSKGLGLGLYISERIVSAHGGAIDVASSEEEGTEFVARFKKAAT